MKRSLLVVICIILFCAMLVPTALAQQLPIVTEPVTVDLMISESSLVPITNDFKFYNKLAEQTGITINFLPVPSSDYATKKSLALATGEIPDIVLIDQNDLNLYASAGLFVNLHENADKLENFFDIVEQIPDAKTTFVDGVAYAFPTLSRWDKTRGSSLIVRSDIMEKVGVDPESISTWEDYEELLRKVQEAYADMAPFIARGKSGMMGIVYAMGSGYGMQYDKNKGMWVYGPATEETKTVLSTLNRWYDEGLLDADYATCSSADWQQKMAADKGFSYLDNVNFAATNYAALQSVVPDAAWQVLDLPLNEFGYARGTFTTPHQLDRLWAISSATEKLDAILGLFDYLYTDEACTLLSLGTEGDDFFYNEDGEPQFTDEVIEKYSTDGVFVKTAMQSECGNASWETFIPYCDNRSYFIQTPDYQEEWYTTIANDPAFDYSVPVPPMTADERESLVDIQLELDTISTEMFDKIIMGLEPVDAFDTYLQEMKDAGYETMVQIYNDAQNRIQ